MQKANDSFNDVATDFVKKNDYRIFWYMSKDESIKIDNKEDNKEKLQEQAWKNTENYLMRKKNTKRKYGRNWCRNISGKKTSNYKKSKKCRDLIKISSSKKKKKKLCIIWNE